MVYKSNAAKKKSFTPKPSSYLTNAKLKSAEKTGCKDHGEVHLIDNGEGDLVCAECVVVVEERMICEEAEWCNFDDDSLAEK